MCVCVCMHEHTYLTHGKHVEVRGQLMEVVLLIHHAGPREQT